MIQRKSGNWSPKQEVETAPEETCNVHTTAEQIDVPNVVGKTEKDATTLLKNKGFTVKVLKNEDKTKAKGIVLKQSSTKAPKGSEISITVNTYNGKPAVGNTINTNTTNTTNTNTIDTNTVGGKDTNTIGNKGNTTKPGIGNTAQPEIIVKK